MGFGKQGTLSTKQNTRFDKLTNSSSTTEKKASQAHQPDLSRIKRNAYPVDSGGTRSSILLIFGFGTYSEHRIGSFC